MSRMQLARLVDKAFWYMLVGVVSYGVKSIHDISDSLTDLNVKIAVFIDQVGHQGDELREHAARLHDIERELIKKGRPHDRPATQ